MLEHASFYEELIFINQCRWAKQYYLMIIENFEFVFRYEDKLIIIFQLITHLS